MEFRRHGIPLKFFTFIHTHAMRNWQEFREIMRNSASWNALEIRGIPRNLEVFPDGNYFVSSIQPPPLTRLPSLLCPDCSFTMFHSSLSPLPFPPTFFEYRQVQNFEPKTF
jgi:hypothetical protein